MLVRRTSWRTGQHEDADRGRPDGGDTETRGDPETHDDETDDGDRQHGRGRYLHHRIGDRDGEVRAEEPAQHEVLDGDRHEPRSRHELGEVQERQAGGRERQEVGQVRHRQQQGGRVREMPGRVGVRAGRDAHVRGDGQHHGGQQDDGRVQAQHRRHHSGEDDDPREEPGGGAVGPARGDGGRPGEQALAVGEMGEQQEDDEEAHRGRDLQDGVLGLGVPDRAHDDQEDGAGERDQHRRDPGVRHHRGEKSADQHHGGDTQGEQIHRHAQTRRNR